MACAKLTWKQLMDKIMLKKDKGSTGIGLIFVGLLINVISPQVALAENYWCHFVQQCTMPNGQCGLASRNLDFSSDQILGQTVEEAGMLVIIDDVETVFIQENGQSSLVKFISGKIPSATVYSGTCQKIGN